jgi:hypothetical protein
LGFIKGNLSLLRKFNILELIKVKVSVIELLEKRQKMQSYKKFENRSVWGAKIFPNPLAFAEGLYFLLVRFIGILIF